MGYGGALWKAQQQAKMASEDDQQEWAGGR
jgi:hypothetical protein